MKLIVIIPLALVSIGLLGDVTQSQLLPTAWCQACTALFYSNGCATTVDNPSIICRILALKLNFNYGGREMCKQFVCDSRADTNCVGLLGCQLGSILVDGICPLGQVCCPETTIDS